jgi:hypothetical protein
MHVHRAGWSTKLNAIDLRQRMIEPLCEHAPTETRMFKCFASYRGAFILAAAVVLGGYLAISHGTHDAAALPFR